MLYSKRNSEILRGFIDDDFKLYGTSLVNNENLHRKLTNSHQIYSVLNKKSTTELIFNNREKLNKNISDFIDEEESNSCYKKLLISKDSTVKTVFDIIVLLLVNISSLIYLFEISFEEDLSQFFKQHYSYYIIEFLFFLFIISEFFHSYQDEETLIIMQDFSSISERYIKSWFFIDLISVIPFELFFKGKIGQGLRLLRLLRLPKFIQAAGRLDELAKTYLSFRNTDNARRLRVVSGLRFFFRILRLFLAASIFSYVLGDLWYVFVKWEYDKYYKKAVNNDITTIYNRNGDMNIGKSSIGIFWNEKNVYEESIINNDIRNNIIIDNISSFSSYTQINDKTSINRMIKNNTVGKDHLNEKNEEEKECFYEHNKFQNSSPIHKLVMCVYFIVTTISTTGYGDLCALNSMEKTLGVFVMLLGVPVFSFVLAEFSEQINEYNRTWGEGVMHGELSDYLSYLSSLSKPSASLLKKVQKHFKNVWSFSRPKKEKQYENLPNSIKKEMANFIWGNVLDMLKKKNKKCNYMFKDISDKKFIEEYNKDGVNKEEINEINQDDNINVNNDKNNNTNVKNNLNAVNKNINDNTLYNDFLFEAGFLLLPRAFEEGEKIVSEDEEMEEMYLITSGSVLIQHTPRVSLLTGENNNVKHDNNSNINATIDSISTPTITLYKGDYFGAYNVLYNTNSEYDYIAKEKCQTFGIRKIPLLQLLSKYPSIRDEYRYIECLRYKEFKLKFNSNISSNIYDNLNSNDLKSANKNDNNNINKNTNINNINNDININNEYNIHNNQNGIYIEKYIGDYKENIRKEIREKRVKLKENLKIFEKEYNKVVNEYKILKEKLFNVDIN